MRKFLQIGFALWMIGSGVAAAGQSQLCIGFWNVENLYDTIPSLFHDDRDYLPDGRNQWGATRYARKLENLARVIDQMSPDVLGLAEVESEQALRDLVLTLHTDYNWIHRTTRDTRGMDVAMLYKGDRFIPDRVRQIALPAGREILYVRGELEGVRVDVVVCHLSSQMNRLERRADALAALYGFADSLHKSDPGARLIVMGDFNADPSERVMRRRFHTGRHTLDGTLFLFSPLHRLHKNGFGSYAYNDRWHLYDNIFLDLGFTSGGGGLRYAAGGIFIRDWMLSDGVGTLRRGYPLRTFSGGAYLGGYSDHLPVWVEFSRSKE